VASNDTHALIDRRVFIPVPLRRHEIDRETPMPQTYNVGSRSIFVTLTAWAFIVLALLASAFALVRSAEVAALIQPWRDATLPLVTGLLVHYLPWLMGAALTVSLVMVVCAVGLLMRLEWARRAAIGLVALVIVANLMGLWLQHELVHALVESTLRGASLPSQVLGMFGGFATAAQLMAMLVTLVGCGLLVWIIRRLMSDAVRQEFA
jgi:hypothetical protein